VSTYPEGVYPADIFTEADGSDDTLSELGPLGALAGVWKGERGRDISPKADGPETTTYREEWTFDPIDRQVNGPQLLYGLRYHQHVNKFDEALTFHDQVGYLLWEPATQFVYMTLAIPRGQVAMAMGSVSQGESAFTLRADVGHPAAGILTNPWMDSHFHTTSWEISFKINGADSFSYAQTTTLHVAGQDEPFAHRDSATLPRVAVAPPNPLAG
jgi:hypothetical protein